MRVVALFVLLLAAAQAASVANKKTEVGLLVVPMVVKILRGRCMLQ